LTPTGPAESAAGPIVESGFWKGGGALDCGFPRAPPTVDAWLRPLGKTPLIEGVPRYGYVLDGGPGPGGDLLIHQGEAAQIVSNLSRPVADPAGNGAPIRT